MKASVKISQNDLSDYEDRKRALIQEIKQRNESKLKISLKKETSNLFRKKSHKAHDIKIDVRQFNHVLNVDKQTKIVEVEGMTTYGDLVKETLKYGLLPTVVPELKSITIGGALAGCGIESSSFRYGLVHERIKETEILLGDGTVVTCSPENEHRDLYYAFPNTFGTLGYALKVKVHCVDAKPYVKLNHLHFSDHISFFSTLQKMCDENRCEGVDFVDSVIFDENKFVITLGEFTDHAEFISNYKYLNIYYKSLQDKQIDYLTTSDYIWRWDSDWFWCSKVFGLQNPVLRALTGKWTLNSTFYTKLMHFSKKYPVLENFGSNKESIIQDISIPIENALNFYQFLIEKIGVLPIWVCPTRSYKDKNLFSFCPMDSDKLYLDFGFWGSRDSIKEEGYYNRLIEKKTEDLKGFKSLYSTSYYTKDEFWKIYDKNLYHSIKQKYDQGLHLRGLYEKCTKK